ncbi:hypothetical protein PMIN01_02590 [Paraphaeosphaeria minitans]|uniref:Uncharacterized protein n=1 Tax=Paraphaeosphaeria minitans TaxID=565426 RepID=A0A9P6GSX0_9PLEO|nr:hypothetical protein PMIN01_02590 [Paraphaeosphaeria minitans]
MLSKGLPVGYLALQCPTPRSTLSPLPTSKPTLKRFKSLATRTGPKDDPFRQAQADSSPLVAIPDDDDDIFGTPCRKKRPDQRRLRESSNRTEEHEDDYELASLLENWQAFLTPERPKRKAGHKEPRAIGPNQKTTPDGSPLASGKWRVKLRSQSSVSSIPGRTTHGSTLLQQSLTEASSPKKRPRWATPELTLKRVRSTDEDNSEDHCNGLPPPKAKRTKLLSTPMKTDREEMHESNPQPHASSAKNSPGFATQRRPPKLVSSLKKKELRTSHVSTSGLATPDASATESPSPGSSSRGVKTFSSSQDTHDQRLEAGNTLSSKSTSSIMIPPSSDPTPRGAKPDKNPSTDIVQTKRKRGAQEAGLSPIRGQLKRVKSANPPGKTEKPTALARLDPNTEAPRRKRTTEKLNSKGTCMLAQLRDKDRN